jgi:hypothetical protein
MSNLNYGIYKIACGWTNSFILHSKSTCFGKNSSHPNVCTGRGICYDRDKCSCEPGYAGVECELNICFGVISSNPDVCSGRGNCIAPNNCSCKTSANGENCQNYLCYGVNSTDSTVCSSAGSCLNIDSCNCTFRNLGNNCQFNISNFIQINLHRKFYDLSNFQSCVFRKYKKIFNDL